MSVSSVKTVFNSRKNVKSIIILALLAVCFGVIGFSLHYSCNSGTSNDNILSYGAGLILFTTLSAVSCGEFVNLLSGKFKAAKYIMLCAAIIGAVEVLPLPFFRQYIPMHNNFAAKSYFIRSLVYTAIIYAVVLLLAAVIGKWRKKYRLKVSIEKISESTDTSL